MIFSLIDWIILLVALSGIVALGVVARKRVVNTTDYLVAGRKVGFYIGILTLFSTETAILTFMYFAEMGYVYGFAAFIAGIIPLVVFVFLGKTGFVIKPFRELGLVTIPEYFERRFSRGVRVLAAVMMVGGGALNFGVFPILDSTFLNIVTGIPQRYILWTILCLMAMVLLYTALGGMVSVVVTSYVQYLFLFLAMTIITIFCFKAVGLHTMVATVQDRMGSAGFNPLSHPASNREGELIDYIHEAHAKKAAGIVINAGGYSHTSIALHDALAAVKIPTVEVHISNIYARESFRHHSFIAKAAFASLCGFGIDGYRLAINGLAAKIGVKAKA